MLGYFDHNKTMLLVNLDSNHPALASVSFRKGYMTTTQQHRHGAGVSTDNAVMMELDGSTGKLTAARDDSPFHPGFQISLLAGDARLFTWQ